MSQAPFLPARSAVLEVIPWPNVTEPHGWLESIARQYELGARDIRVDLLVNDKRANLVLNWHALARDPVWAALSAEEKVALQERGTCPKAHEPRCFFEWLHWRSELVLDPQALGKSLKPLLERADALSTKVDSV
ncbi:hypothetical protein H632_c5082p0 [Helicosporidium sp. ATCC 50920]|nr:hypothetical protein H632_c5082p0 [Helicosporidium sp. ATCC 50920]|eukprot:KDD71414.1 hypothetical protein H632_c5082p0 [Helicosporidium sp. ATCC 50920]